MQRGIRASQQSTDGDCGNVCPETSLAPSDLKHAQSPKSILSTGPKFCMRSTGWEQQALQLLLSQSTARGEGRTFAPHVQGHWGHPDRLTGPRSTPRPELEQLKCQAELGHPGNGLTCVSRGQREPRPLRHLRWHPGAA